LRKISRFKN